MLVSSIKSVIRTPSLLRKAVFDIVRIIVAEARCTCEVVTPRAHSGRQNHLFTLAFNQNFIAAEAVIPWESEPLGCGRW